MGQMSVHVHPCTHLYRCRERNTTPVLHFCVQAGAQSEPLPCHVQRDEIYYVEKKKSEILVKKILKELKSHSDKQSSHGRAGKTKGLIVTKIQNNTMNRLH